MPDLPEESQTEVWFVYIIETFCGKLYTGITVNVERRYQEHCEVHEGISNKGAKFFRGHKPKRLVLVESWSSRSEASKRETQIKAMRRQAKIKLFSGEQN